MILFNYLVAALMFGLGLFAVLTRRNLIKIVLGLSLMESSMYVLLLSLAYRSGSTAPVLLEPPKGQSENSLVQGNVSDPFLQNLCLTAIVIGVAVTAVLLACAVRIAQHYRTLDPQHVRGLRG